MGSGRRRDSDDPPVSPFHHAGQYGVATVEDAVEVHAQWPLPLVRDGVHEPSRQHGFGATVAGVVDQHVDWSGGIDGGGHGLPVGHIERHRFGITAKGGCNLVGPVWDHVVDQHPGSGVG